MRGPRFDLALVVGCAGLALAVGALARANPYDVQIFTALLMADIWLLGSHHIVAMFTRLCFDKESMRENKFFLTGLPIIVLVGIVAVLWISGGREIITTIYLYWQFFHYTRQSYGISRIYGRKEPPQSVFDVRLTNFIIYAVPTWGILFISHLHNLDPTSTFLGSAYWSIPVPEPLLQVVGYVAGLATLVWLARIPFRYLEKKLAILPTLYILSHLIIFTAGYWWYGQIHLNLGWLVINIWHNSQYILIVWLYNNNRFKNGVDQNSWFLSYISQEKFLGLYFVVCLAITGVFFGMVKLFAAKVAPNYLPQLITDDGWAILAYQGLNFHHYIVDGYIWKVRKKRLRERLGVVDEEIASVAT